MDWRAERDSNPQPPDPKSRRFGEGVVRPSGQAILGSCWRQRRSPGQNRCESCSPAVCGGEFKPVAPSRFLNQQVTPL